MRGHNKVRVSPATEYERVRRGLTAAWPVEARPVPHRDYFPTWSGAVSSRVGEDQMSDQLHKYDVVAFIIQELSIGARRLNECKFDQLLLGFAVPRCPRVVEEPSFTQTVIFACSPFYLWSDEIRAIL
jgi:hypothetical protein